MLERLNWKAVLVAAFFIFLAANAPPALASLSVSPVRVDLNDDHSKDVVRVSNRDTIAKSYEVTVVAWSQTSERREVYAETEEILAVPPLFTLQPGEDQIVRVGMLQEADPGKERSYRMFVTELTPPLTEANKGEGISMRVQIGVPVFVAPTALPTATLDYIDSLQVEEHLFLQFGNNGNTNIKVLEIQYQAPAPCNRAKTR